MHDPSWRMTQRLPPSLTPLDTALAALLTGLDPLAPMELQLSEAAGCIAADNPLLPARPSRDVAAADGWALCANDLVGASSYSPLPLETAPAWVDAGDAMPAGCDCVLDADAVEVSGPLAQVLAEGVPGQGVRGAGREKDGGKPRAPGGGGGSGAKKATSTDKRLPPQRGIRSVLPLFCSRAPPGWTG